MGRISSFQYPDLRLSDAVGVVERITKEYRGSITTSGLAQALNMSEKGGGFLHKVAGLRDYGLVEGRGELRVTPLAQRIILPNSAEEEAKARAEAFLRVELFQKLHERLGGEVPDPDRFAIILGGLTKADRIEVRRKAVTLRRYYADVVDYLQEPQIAPEGGEPGATLKAPSEPREPERPQRGPSSDLIELIAGNMHLSLPRTVASIDIIQSALTVLREELESRSVATDPDSTQANHP